MEKKRKSGIRYSKNGEILSISWFFRGGYMCSAREMSFCEKA